MVSGCQTGADEAGLEAAKQQGIETFGYMPKSFRTDAGMRPDLALRYGLTEADTRGYPERTKRNVGLARTTILFGNDKSPGCLLTQRLMREHNQKGLHLPFPHSATPHERGAEISGAFLLHWLRGTFDDNFVVNIAGNRERTNPGIYDFVFRVCMIVFKELR